MNRYADHSRRFDAVAADLIGIEAAVGDAKRDAESRTKFAYEFLIGIRFRAAKMMIDVRR